MKRAARRERDRAIDDAVSEWQSRVDPYDLIGRGYPTLLVAAVIVAMSVLLGAAVVYGCAFLFHVIRSAVA